MEAEDLERVATTFKELLHDDLERVATAIEKLPGDEIVGKLDEINDSLNSAFDRIVEALKDIDHSIKSK